MAEKNISPNLYVIVPAYKEQSHIGQTVRSILEYSPNVLVVDDGSRDKTSEYAEEAGAVVLRHKDNRGKGEALKTGFQYARDQACDLVITMDADGQHRPDEIPKFVDAYRRTGIPILLGNRMADIENMPRIRRWTNAVMSWMLSRIMKQYIPDTQCGFRMYRGDILPFLSVESQRFAAESEILLYLADRGFRIDSVRVSTIYHNEKSMIKPGLDTLRFIAMILRHMRNRKKGVAGRK